MNRLISRVLALVAALVVAAGVPSLAVAQSAAKAKIVGYNAEPALRLDFAGNDYAGPAQNLLTRSQELDLGIWSGPTTVTADQAVAPDGTNTADLLTAAADYSYRQNMPSGLTPGAVYTASVYLKAGTHTATRVQLRDPPSTIVIGVRVNLSNCTITQFPAPSGGAVYYGSSASSVGNGWCRFTLTGAIPGAGQFGLGIDNENVGAGNLYAWGAQLVRGGVSQTYTPTSGAAALIPGASVRYPSFLSIPGATVARTHTGFTNACADRLDGSWDCSFAANVLRLTDKGTLVEEARKNEVTNSAASGAVAGTPGTAPTGWTISSPYGLSQQIVGTGTDLGLPYIDIRYFGTTAGLGGTNPIAFNAAVTAAEADVWTHTFGVRLVGGTANNGLTLQAQINFPGPSSSFNGSTVTPTADLQWLTVTATAPATTTAMNGRPRFAVTASGVAMDFTLRFYVPQNERGAWRTSPIITTAAAGTRGADAPKVSIPASVLNTPFVLLVTAIVPQGVTNDARISLSNSAAVTTERIYFVYSGTTVAVNANSANGTSFIPTGSKAVSAGQRVKMALAWDGTKWKAALNGSSYGTPVNSVTPSNLDTLEFASSGGTIRQWGAQIESSVLRPGVFTDTQLQAMTTP